MSSPSRPRSLLPERRRCGRAGGTRPSQGDAGYSITEAAVALALVLTVVVPALGTLLYFTTRTGSAGPSQAVALVRNEAERALAALDAHGAPPTRPSEHAWEAWTVASRWTEAEGWAALYVEAGRSASRRPPPAPVDAAAERRAPAAWLRTGRFVPDLLPSGTPSEWP